MKTSYLIPAAPVDYEEIIKGSHFITRIRCASDTETAKAFIKKMKLAYSDASHHCWTYLIGNPLSTTLKGCSDDGEPPGTAGKPMLNVLQHSAVGDIVIVCTRYFGGTKLGTGGPARAYGGGTKLAHEKLLLKEKINYKKIDFTIDYSLLKDCEHILNQYQTEFINFDYQSKVRVSVNMQYQAIDDFKTTMINQFKGRVKWNTTS